MSKNLHAGIGLIAVSFLGTVP